MGRIARGTATPPTRNRPQALGLLGLALAGAIGWGAGAAPARAAPPSPYTVANYPVQARADDAVTAKAQALADGQQGAFRALLKRLVPVTAYRKLPKLQLVRVQDMISGFSVRRESNSSTEYIASLDFEFQARAVKELLKSHGVPMIEDMAPPIVVVPVYRPPGALASSTTAKAGKSKAQPQAAPTSIPAHLEAQRAGAAWSKAWADIDIEHALTPVRLSTNAANVRDDTLSGLLAGDEGLLRTLAGENQNDRVVLALAQPTEDGRKLTVTLVGRDAVGALSLTRSFRIYDADVAYATELAAIVALGIIEGRWKVLKSRPAGAPQAGIGEGWSATTDRNDGITTSTPSTDAQSADSDAVELTVEFRGIGQWQQVRSRIAGLPGVEDLEVAQMSARGALLTLRYPGGGPRLAEELGSQGLQMDQRGGQWVLQAR